MIPKNHANRKTRINLNCPSCGISLSKAVGFNYGSETYCCAACATGLACTCDTKPAQHSEEPQATRRQRLAESQEYISRPRIR